MFAKVNPVQKRRGGNREIHARNQKRRVIQEGGSRPAQGGRLSYRAIAKKIKSECNIHLRLQVDPKIQGVEKPSEPKPASESPELISGE
ncbi:MAG: hypothetical protein QXR19_14380 [Candidatus Jordarchaeaceae archaeon]